MQKSLGNIIYLFDSPEELSRKVKGMFTDLNHARIEDPEVVEGKIPAMDTISDAKHSMSMDYQTT